MVFILAYSGLFGFSICYLFSEEKDNEGMKLDGWGAGEVERRWEKGNNDQNVLYKFLIKEETNFIAKIFCPLAQLLMK